MSRYLLFDVDLGLSRLLFDTFTGAAGTELSAHTPDVDPGLGAYQELTGDHELIAGNLLGVITGGMFHKDIGKAIGYSKIDVLDTGNNNPALIFNGVDIDNFWSLFALDVSNTIELREKTAGGFINRDTAAYFFFLTIVLKLERAAGDVINGYADDMDTPLVTFTSTVHNTGTSVGVRSNVSTQEYDNLEGWG